MRNTRNHLLTLRHPSGFLTRMVLTLFLLCALTTVNGGTPYNPNTRSLQTSFYQRNNNNNNVNINSNQNDKNENKNENNNKDDEDDEDDGEFAWSRPWDVSETTDLGVQPTEKPTKAPTTEKPTKTPTTAKPTFPPTIGSPTW
jgi:hypothetical protein